MQTVLIVDNSRVVRKILQERIIYGLRLDTQVAATLEEARTCIEQNPSAFFLAVLGLTLADAPNGEIVDYVLTWNIPVIVLTASSIESVKAQIRSSQKIIDYVVKNDRNCFDQIVALIQQIQKNQQIKILVVSSLIFYRDHIVRLLEAHRYTPLEAENGDHALEILSFYPEIKLIITDYNMPKMDGPELIAYVRKTYSRNQLAILGFFSSENHLAPSELMHAGADDFLAVPFFDEEFYCRITRLIEFFELVEKPLHSFPS